MATKIFLPRLGESITEAVLGRWLKKPGDPVVRGEVIAELETDKAMMELESPVKGVLLAAFPKAGQTVHLDELIALVGIQGEDWESAINVQSESSEFKGKNLNQKKETNQQNKAEKKPGLRISPNAKRRAKELGINFTVLTSINKDGRITARDIETSHLVNDAQEFGLPAFSRIPLNQVQIVTARRISESAKTIPQFSVSVDVVAEQIVQFINNQKSVEKRRITITAVLIKKTTEALQNHPRLNSRFDNNTILQFHDVNIAVAIAAPEGLFVPVIHQVQKLTLEDISNKLSQLSTKAKNNRLELNDTQGATFTISNLGMRGITSFAPIVDLGQAAILGVGAINKKIYLDENQKTKQMLTMNLTLSTDHRIVDGAIASDFLATLRQLLEIM